MLGKNIVRKFVTLTTLATVWCVYSMVALAAAPGNTTGEITVTGQVTVNGASAISGATVFTDSTITTAKGSSAVVSLGKLGRVEVQEETTMKLSFSDGGMIAMLDSGRVRVSSSAGIASTVTTKHGIFIGDASQADNYLVEAECSHAHVDTMTGLVTMREGSSDKQVAAGSSATAGSLVQTGCKPCMRPGSTPPPAYAGMTWLLLLGAAAAGLAIYFGTRNENNEAGGTVTVVSPVR